MNSKDTSPYNSQVKNFAGNPNEKIVLPMETGFSICVTYEFAQHSSLFWVSNNHSNGETF